MIRGLVLVVVLVSLSACGSGAGSDSGGGDPARLTVFAASSLKDSFEAMGRAFEQEHDGVRVDFNFAGSSDLVAQVEQGAPADVVATADTATLERLAEADLLAGEPTPFATNRLMIATPADNPAGITALADLARDDVQLVTCAPQVPCGAAAAQVEENAGLDWSPVSEEPSVAEVLGKVRSGEADAGLVYVTDVRLADDDVHGIAIDSDVVNTYPIAAVADSDEAELGRAFIELVLEPGAGQRVLGQAGFGRP